VSILKFSVSDFVFLRIYTLLICWEKLFNFLSSRGPPGVRGPQVKNRCNKEYWDVIDEVVVAVLNDILKQGELSGTPKQGIIIFFPKKPHPSSTADFSPITLLTTDYKIQTKTLANGLKPYLTKLVHASQKGCVPGRTHTSCRIHNTGCDRL
jgi:hypothetical protein